MLRSVPTGTWMPAWVPESTTALSVVLLLCSAVQSATGGYDGSLLNGLNILPSYTAYFHLTPATRGLTTAAIFIGGFFGPLAAGPLSDHLGRRPAIFWSTLATLVAVVLQGAAQHVAMFVVARILLGAASAVSSVACNVYLSETFPSRWRTWGVGLLNNFYYVGALIAAVITLGTSQWTSTWAWRAPSFFQALFAVICLLFLPFIPESPRWLVARERYAAAREVVALANADGNARHPVALAVYKQIVDTLAWERENRHRHHRQPSSKSSSGNAMSFREICKSPSTRRRLVVGASVGPLSCIAGNIIASYYLGDELATAGIRSSRDQLRANVVLNIWCLACCLFGTGLADRWGRRPTALLSQSLLVLCLFIIGALSKVYADNPAEASGSLIYADVAVMFLFQGFYSVAWTPLLTLYPPEVFNYPIRANGCALSSFLLNGLALLLVFIMPIGLHNIGWKMYIINGSWDILSLIFIAVYWVETKGKTLEEIDALFEDDAHTSIGNVENIRKGHDGLDVETVEKELQNETGFKGSVVAVVPRTD